LLPSPWSRLPPPPPVTPPARITKQETNRAQATSSGAPTCLSPNGTLGGVEAAAGAQGETSGATCCGGRPGRRRRWRRRRHGRRHAPLQVQAACRPPSPQASRRFRPERMARAPERSPGSSTAAGHSPTSPRDAALRSRAHLKRTTELLTKVHARSRPLVLDLRLTSAACPQPSASASSRAPPHTWRRPGPAASTRPCHVTPPARHVKTLPRPPARC